MSNQKPLNVGLVGYGFMGRTHSNAYGKVNQFFDLDRRPVLKAVCGRNESNVKAFAERWGYQSTETDWHKLLSRSDIDLVDIATPNDSHAEIAIAAAKAGKMVMCEKPLGSMRAASARSFTIEPSFCRTGPSRKICHRGAPDCGGSMQAYPVAA